MLASLGDCGGSIFVRRDALRYDDYSCADGSRVRSPHLPESCLERFSLVRVLFLNHSLGFCAGLWDLVRTLIGSVSCVGSWARWGAVLWRTEYLVERSMSEHPYIEVTGESTYEEQISLYRFELELTVRATKGDTALDEVLQLRNSVVECLHANAIRDDEIAEGGAELWRSWWWRRKVGQEAHQKILIEVDDFARFATAAAALEPLFENQRYFLAVHTQQSEFEAEEETKDESRRMALQDAKRKADLIAKETGTSLGAVLQVEQQSSTASRTGMYGDERWRGIAIAAVGGGGSDEGAPVVSLDGASRVVQVSYRVRYRISD